MLVFGVLLIIGAVVFLLIGLVNPRAALPFAKPPTRLKASALAALMLAGGIASGVAGAGDQPPTPSAQNSGPVPSTAVPTVPLPDSQTKYIAAVVAARGRYADAPNELRKSSVFADMMTDIRAAVPQGIARDWVGTLRKMGTNSDGNAWVEIEIADGMTIQTWNNAFSDLSDHTLIRNGSPLYQRLAALDPGVQVVFTAQLIRLSDLTEAGKVQAPEMTARFVDIRPLGR